MSSKQCPVGQPWHKRIDWKSVIPYTLALIVLSVVFWDWVVAGTAAFVWVVGMFVIHNR